MSNTNAGPIIAAIPVGIILTEEVKKTLFDIFGNWDARHLATQHPSVLLVELQGKFWGLNCLEIIVAMQNHLEQTV